ncbi:hypothetical protein HYX70_00415 [Candidatus Saccharibacteria bacterium]|nr:hypothetical protein [Candidatus Saccharibacteria bacterium]
MDSTTMHREAEAMMREAEELEAAALQQEEAERLGAEASSGYNPVNIF